MIKVSVFGKKECDGRVPGDVFRAPALKLPEQLA